jgi:hypothetical protein
MASMDAALDESCDIDMTMAAMNWFCGHVNLSMDGMND